MVSQMQFSLMRLFLGVTIIAILAGLLLGQRVTLATITLASGAAAIGCLLLAKRLAVQEADNNGDPFSSPAILALPLFFVGVGCGILCLYSLGGVIAGLITR
jgi:hypothetical protein